MMNKLKNYFNDIKSLLLKDVFYNHSGKHSHYEEEIKFLDEWIDLQLTVKEIYCLFDKTLCDLNVDEDLLDSALTKLEKQKKLLEEE